MFPLIVLVDGSSVYVGDTVRLYSIALETARLSFPLLPLLFPVTIASLLHFAARSIICPCPPLLSNLITPT